MINKLHTTLGEAGLKLPLPVVLLNEVGEEYKNKAFDVDGRKFKMPLSNGDRGELRNILNKKAKGD